VNLHPKYFIFPAILISCLALVFISLSVNAGYAQAEQIAEITVTTADTNHTSSISRVFPEEIQQWNSLIVTHAHEFNIDPNLIAAVVLQESGGNPTAISSSGAVGLMQVMPRDGIAASFECINGPCFANRPMRIELTDPEFNIHYGVKMLSSLISKTGSPREALKLYGPADVGYYYADIILAIKANHQ